MNGTLYDRAPLPPEVAILAGTSLGISAFCHVRENVLLRSHLDVLERAAGALGYTGFDAESAAATVTAAGEPEARVALVPTPADHRAAAPGDDWMLVVEAFRPPVATGPLRLATSVYRRNHRSPTAHLLLLGDVELLEGARRAAADGWDDVVWLNLDDAVACSGAGALFARTTDGRVVTPPLSAGVPETAWRAACVDATGAREQRFDHDDLRSATSVACLTPWGTADAVAAVDDVERTDDSLATLLDEALAGLGVPR